MRSAATDARLSEIWRGACNSGLVAAGAARLAARRSFRNALDEVKRRQHQHLFRFGLNPEEVTLLDV